MVDLEEAFLRYGKANIGLKNGFAFVRYERSRDAEEAIRNLSNRTIAGCSVRVEWSSGGAQRGGGRDKERIPFGGGEGGAGGGGGGRGCVCVAWAG